MKEPDPATWCPDAATLRWASGVIDEDRVRSTLIRTHRRLKDEAGPDEDTDRYWGLMAEAAVEAAVWSIAERAKGWNAQGGGSA